MNRGERPVGVAGAGSIGCFVGGALAAAGRRVALLARPRVIGEIRDNGLRLTNFDGSEQRLPANQLTVSSDPSILGEAGVVLVTVKSADTAEIADILAQTCAAGRRDRQPAERRRQCRRVARAVAWTKGARRHGAVQRDLSRRRTVSSLDLGRHRGRTGRRARPPQAFRCPVSTCAPPTTSKACSGAS